MSVEKKNSHLGDLLKNLMKEHSFSMRKLSALTGMDTATISRIVNGKQQVKMEHLQKFALHLQVSIETLLRATGIEIEKETEKINSNIYESIDIIQDVLASSNFFDQNFTVQHVQQELLKYEHFALTKEGEDTILEDFPSKVEQVSAAGPFIDQLKQMYNQYRQDTLPQEERALLGSALLYFILSTDIIPDYVFPFGYLDDCLAVQLVLDRLSHLKES